MLYYNPLSSIAKLVKHKEYALKKHLIFVGSTFIFNTPLQAYIVRQIKEKLDHLDSITYFQESDNSLFLHLEQRFSKECMTVIVASKSSFPVIGKLLSTITADNQILKEQMLIPSRTTLFEHNSYLLKHEHTAINVILASEGEALPNILFDDDVRSAVIQLFNEEKENARAMLEPLAQTYEVRFDLTEIVSGWLQLRIQSGRYGNIAQFIASCKQLLPSQIIPASNIAAYIIERLQHNQKKITFAESCTGGLLAAFLTRESGASAVFEGSLVTYSNTLKSNWLAVDDAKFEAFGAVSPAVVEEMTEGAINVSYADYAIAVSGIAGPGGATETKKVGTVCINVRSKTEHRTEELHFCGDRNYVQEQSTLYAVKMLLLLDKKTFFEKS